jgi:UDP-N-acetylmuramyl pentapeptide phosphotransferase/UDP-N-acetylglucosamine-1-phosphate transferase
MPLYSPLIAALIVFLLISLILRSKFSHGIQDIPNARSLHSTPTPRIGGLALMIGLLISWSLLFNALTWWLLLPLLALFAVSLLDDMHNLPVKQRLLIHLGAAALMVIGSGIASQHGILLAILLFFLTVWMTNLFNFMDGSDGLAGGMALFGFGFYGLAALLNQQLEFALLNFCVAAAALGFLLKNFPPAKVFMGDAGSIPLGFLAAAMGVWGWQQGTWSAWFPLLVFSPFIVDASVTLAKRSWQGLKITEAHRDHYYQRIIQSGWAHRKVALVEYSLMFCAGLSALVYAKTTFPLLLLINWFAIYIPLMLLIDARWKRFLRSEN